MIAGIILPSTGAFHDGARVKLGGTVGDVVEKRLPDNLNAYARQIIA